MPYHHLSLHGSFVGLGGKKLKNSLGLFVDWFEVQNVSVLGRLPPSTTTRSTERVKLITREEENPVVGWLVGWLEARWWMGGLLQGCICQCFYRAHYSNQT